MQDDPEPPEEDPEYVPPNKSTSPFRDEPGVASNSPVVPAPPTEYGTFVVEPNRETADFRDSTGDIAIDMVRPSLSPAKSPSDDLD